MTAVVAPARLLLTVVHLRDNTRPAGETRNRDGTWRADANTGWTVCGLPMRVDEVWIAVANSTAPLCSACAGDVSAQPDLFGGAL